jgi:hypothetical protein
MLGSNLGIPCMPEHAFVAALQLTLENCAEQVVGERFRVALWSARA